MRAASLILAATIASSGLAACHKGPTSICTPFPEAASSTNAPGAIVPAPGADPAAALDDCLHRWGYTLAVTLDRAPDVGQATVAACTPALTRWNQAALSMGTAGPQAQAGAPTAPSLLTGQPTNPIAEHFAYAQARALFYVVQARAGKCAPPSTIAPGGASAR
jgi:hypothetical protein